MYYLIFKCPSSWGHSIGPQVSSLLGRLYLRPFQRHFHSLGLTDRFMPQRRSDPLVLANLLRRWQDPCFLTSGIPLRTFQAKLTIFTDASTQGWGAYMGDSQISGTWTHADRKLHINCLELKGVFHALTFYSTQPNRPRASPAIFKHVGQVPYSRGFKFGEKGRSKFWPIFAYRSGAVEFHQNFKSFQHTA